LIAEEPGVQLQFSVTVDRGEDIGQNFGSLFEISSQDGALVIGAGFQNHYNTRYRGDRHAIQFFVRPTDGERSYQIEPLPRPNALCGTYLMSRDGVLYSMYGGVKSWDAQTGEWKPAEELGGTSESMRVGEELLEFGDSVVQFRGEKILDRPARGRYLMFFYANGHLCFYHVDNGNRPYRAFTNEADGFSRLHACPWVPGNGPVDLSQAITLTLPVVGETTFAWGQSGGQIFTGSNIGGFYLFEAGQWRMLLEPELNTSFQLYSSVVSYDRMLLGQYPTGRMFAFDGRQLAELPNSPPVLTGVSPSSREAQTSVIYAGDLMVGVWPWGEVWRQNPGSGEWQFLQRMFNHPDITDRVIHPYDEENRGNPVSNLWGQRVTSMIPLGADLYISTSAKGAETRWEPERYPFLAPEKWKSYGTVWRLRMPGHLSASTAWTAGQTTLDFSIRGTTMTISQDGQKLAETTISGPLADQLRRVSKFQPVRWDEGIYGKFTGRRIHSTMNYSSSAASK
jgi:hypothetical protein